MSPGGPRRVPVTSGVLVERRRLDEDLPALGLHGKDVGLGGDVDAGDNLCFGDSLPPIGSRRRNGFLVGVRSGWSCSDR
jgi:hypothetical protein